ncbi:MAG: ribonuclease J [Armatimonadota bacterium]
MKEWNIEQSRGKLHIIPLGGVMEIGKNITAYVYDEEILVVDGGLMFPEEEMLGVDIVIPDVSFLEEHSDKVLGIVLTHGHEDHIGALPYILRRLDCPVWGTPLTLGFLSNKLSEHKMLEMAKLNTVSTDAKLEIGNFKVEYVRVSHSIPDACGIIIHTPNSIVVHTSDFKFDQTPIDGNLADVNLLAKTGELGVDVLLCDSTNVEKSGFTPSESRVGESIDQIFAEAQGRIIIAAFASNIHRVQQVFNIAAKHNRKVAVVGRSMEANVRIAEELGYLKIPEGVKIGVESLDKLDTSEIAIMTTGSQGEPLSALSRMAMDEHKYIKVEKGDVVIISATPIPGNEDLVLRTVNRLFKLGAEVVYETNMNIHSSGHANQEDIKFMLNIIKPKYVIPVHGEARHFSKFVKLAKTVGYSDDNILEMNPGDVLAINTDGAQIVGRVHAGMIMVDGLGVGDVEDPVLRDRRHLANDGIVIAVIGIDINTMEIVSGPDILTRGVMGEEYASDLIDSAKDAVIAKLDDFLNEDSVMDIDGIKAITKKAILKVIHDATHRRPMIVPIVLEL